MSNQEKKSFAIKGSPRLPLLPGSVKGVKDCKKCITHREEGGWKFLFEGIDQIPSPCCEKQDYDFSRIPCEKWQDVVVPSSLIMQGFDIENNTEYYYKKEVEVPTDFKGNRVYLRFEGVYSNARIWINNQYIRHHVGGFTPWDCDITPFAGEKHITLIVGVTDVEGDQRGLWNPAGGAISNAAWASYYAHHNIGGILRDITLFALPDTYLAQTHVHTTVRADLKRAVVCAQVELCTASSSTTLSARLIDPRGNEVAVYKETHQLTPQNEQTADLPQLVITPSAKWTRRFAKNYKNDMQYSRMHQFAFPSLPAGVSTKKLKVELDAAQPVLWDAEHPHLYRLVLTLTDDSGSSYETSCAVGIRQITYGGADGTDTNKVYINGRPIKLHGVCRHDVSHLYGRSLTREDIKQELLSYKQHNINHVRTSHYPASDYYLELCDELGIYVEQENAACFKGANNFGIYNAPEEFLSVFAEMVESARNHPSVIIWSLANESGFEKTCAFRGEYEYIKQMDPSRPVIFSYPKTVQTKPLPYDIFSRHYQKVTGNLGNKKLPVLHDEFAHVACYNLEQLAVDNSCRDFWGQSIKKGWDNLFATDGALGCAIWGAVDDVFYLPKGTKQRHQAHGTGRCAGYGEWGCILDAYHRLKPEAYLTKKAFTPVSLDMERSGMSPEFRLWVTNRFDHTDLSEVRMVCIGADGTVHWDGCIPQSIPPHESGWVQLNRRWAGPVQIEFYFDSYLVDTYFLGAPKNTTQNQKQAKAYPLAIDLQKNPDSFILAMQSPSGKIPFAAFNGDDNGAVLQKVQHLKTGVSARIRFKNGLKCHLHFTLEGDRLVCFAKAYGLLLKPKEANPFHLRFRLLEEVTAVSWSRQSDACCYPDGHISRPEGTAFAKREGCEETPDRYGKKPAWGWEKDMVSYFLSHELPSNSLTNDFRARRNSIHAYTVHFQSERKLCISAASDALGAYVRLKEEDKACHYELELTEGAYYPDLAWGNYIGKKQGKKQMAFSLSLCPGEEADG